ncbi:MAG TPA: nucleoside diphosphate kinase regulator [Burkholderiales bacterium]|nr:nucleoside diphosphate kinase regulator [Burkholderiales bacterium]
MIWLTAQDYSRLRGLLSDLGRRSRGVQAGVEALEEILDFARVVGSDKVPANVVTMKSLVRYVDMASGEEAEATIVYPAEADANAGRISVLSPMGAALLGESEGNEIDLPLPYGHKRRIRIAQVLYQPEAQGDLAL